jgi:ornithine cyclodeaminase/alanine dehydrogenase-like protein (mu-crystallin family)
MSKLAVVSEETVRSIVTRQLAFAAVANLARPDAGVLGVIGAGQQAEQEIRAVAEAIYVAARETDQVQYIDL